MRLAFRPVPGVVAQSTGLESRLSVCKPNGCDTGNHRAACDGGNLHRSSGPKVWIE